MYQYFIFFLVPNDFYYLDIPHVVYPFFSWWTFTLFLLFGCYEWCSYEHSCTSFCVYIYFNFYLLYTWGGIAGHMITLCVIFWGTTKTVFQSCCTILHSHQQHMKVPISSQPHRHLLLCVYYVSFISGYEWYIFVDLIFISLMANDVEHFLCVYWSFVYLLWKNFYSNSLLIKKYSLINF